MRDKNNIVWSSTATHDFWLYEATDAEVVFEYKEYHDPDAIASDYQPDIDFARKELYNEYSADEDYEMLGELKLAGDSEVIEMYCDYFGAEAVTVDDMRSYLAYGDADYDADYEDLEMNIAPEIAQQCYNDYLWVIGNYERWDGGHIAFAFYDNAKKGVISICYPGYDSHSKLLDDDGNIVFTESTHDTPMGGTYMTLYSIKDENVWDAAEEYLNNDYIVTDNDGKEWHIPEYWGYEADILEISEDADALSALIDMGYLTPVRALF